LIARNLRDHVIRLDDSLRRGRRKLLGRKTERSLRTTNGLSYTEDWTSHHFPIWEKLFAEFYGLAHLEILEVGSHEGRSAAWFLTNLATQPSSSLTCIDPFLSPAVEHRFDHNLTVIGAKAAVRKMRLRSDEALPQLDSSQFHIVYIDGVHVAANVALDALLAWPLVRPNGILLFDDYRWRPDRADYLRPPMAIDAFLNVLKGQFELLERGEQVAIRKL
jgi:predicted O-methyltransferase YrrM